jgi:ATP-binding cassette, subfamily B, bacterial
VRLAVDFKLMSTAIERLHSLPLAYHRDQSVGATMTTIERGIAGTMPRSPRSWSGCCHR